MQECYAIKSMEGKPKAVDIDKGCRELILCFYWSLFLSLVVVTPVLLDFFFKESSIWWLAVVPVVFAMNLFTVPTFYSDYKYGTKYRLFCSLFLKCIEQSRACTANFFRCFQWSCGKLRQRVYREDLAELLFVGKAFLVQNGMIRNKGRGRWLRGAQTELNLFVKNKSFYRKDIEGDPSYDTMLRYSRGLADEGECFFA